MLMCTGVPRGVRELKLAATQVVRQVSVQTHQQGHMVLLHLICVRSTPLRVARLTLTTPNRLKEQECTRKTDPLQLIIVVHSQKIVV